MKQENKKSRAKIKSKKAQQQYQAHDSFKQTIDAAIEKLSEIENHQPLRKREFKVRNCVKPFINPPLPSPLKFNNNTAKGSTKCHTLISSTPYCGNKISHLQSPEGSPIQLDSNEKNNDGSSVIYVGTKQNERDETLINQIVTATSPTKNAVNLKSNIPVPIKRNRSWSRHSDDSPSKKHCTEDYPKNQTGEESPKVVFSNQSRSRKKKRNVTFTELNYDEVGSHNKKACHGEPTISTPANSTREGAIQNPNISGIQSDSVNAEYYRYSTSPSPLKKNRSKILPQNEETPKVFQGRTRSEKRNENMTLSNTAMNHSTTKKENKTICDVPSPQRKATKDMQTSMGHIKHKGETLASAEVESDRCTKSPRKNRSRTEVKKTTRKRRSKSETIFKGDAENSATLTRNKSFQVTTLPKRNMTKDAQTSMELVKCTGSRINPVESTSINDNPKVDIIEEIQQRKKLKLLNTTEAPSIASSTSNIARERVGLDRVSSVDMVLNHVERNINNDFQLQKMKKKKNFENLISDLEKFVSNAIERERQELQLEEKSINSVCYWSSSSSHVSTNSQASSTSSNRRFRVPHRTDPYENSCVVLKNPVVPKRRKNKSLVDQQHTIESVVSKLKSRMTEHKGVQTSTRKSSCSRAPVFRRSSKKARNVTIQDTTIVPTVSRQSSVGLNIFDSVKEGNVADCLRFSALQEDGLVENQDKPWRYSHSSKSVSDGGNITVPSFIRPESQIMENDESWLSNVFHKPANNRDNVKNKSLQNNGRLSRQVLTYSSDEDSEFLDCALPSKNTLVQGENKEYHGLQRRTYARTRQLSTQNSMINDAPDDESVVVAKVDQSQKRSGKNRDVPSSTRNQHASDICEAGPLRIKPKAKTNKNKSLLDKSKNKQLPQTPPKNKRANSTLTPSTDSVQQRMQAENIVVNCQEEVSKVSEEPGPSCHPKTDKNKSLYISLAQLDSGIKQLPHSPTRSKRGTKYLSTLEQPAISNNSELQQSIQDDNEIENLNCQVEVASEVSEEPAPTCNSLLGKSGTRKLPKSPAKNAPKPILTTENNETSNRTQLLKTGSRTTRSRLENTISKDNCNTSGLFATNVEDNNFEFKVPQDKSIRKRKTKSNNKRNKSSFNIENISNTTSQLGEGEMSNSTSDIQIKKRNTSTRKRKSSNASSSRNTSILASRPLASVNIANIIPSGENTRSLRKRVSQKTLQKKLLEEFEDLKEKKQRLVFLQPYTLKSEKSTKKRKESKKNSTIKSTSMRRVPDLSAIVEQPVETDQSGPSSSCLMPPPPAQNSTVHHPRLQEITADSGFENSNSKTLQRQDHTATKKPTFTPAVNRDDDITQRVSLDQEEPVPPTLDDGDNQKNLTSSSTITASTTQMTQQPVYDIRVQKEMTVFCCKQPPLKAYKKSGNLYQYESENPPDGSMGYLRLKPNTEANSEEPLHNMTFFVIKGNCEVQLENHSSIARLVSGDRCYIPRGRKYTISNSSRYHLVIIYSKH